MPAKTTAERQKIFKEKMYKAGLMQAVVWIKRKEAGINKEINVSDFVKKLKVLVKNWNEDDVSNLLNLFLKITRAKKEVNKLIKKP